MTYPGNLHPLKCPKCGYFARVRARVRTHDYICEHCGHTWPRPPQNTEKEN